MESTSSRDVYSPSMLFGNGGSETSPGRPKRPEGAPTDRRWRQIIGGEGKESLARIAMQEMYHRMHPRHGPTIMSEVARRARAAAADPHRNMQKRTPQYHRLPGGSRKDGQPPKTGRVWHLEVYKTGTSGMRRIAGERVRDASRDRELVNPGFVPQLFDCWRFPHSAATAAG